MRRKIPVSTSHPTGVRCEVREYKVPSTLKAMLHWLVCLETSGLIAECSNKFTEGFKKLQLAVNDGDIPSMKSLVDAAKTLREALLKKPSDNHCRMVKSPGDLYWYIEDIFCAMLPELVMQLYYFNSLLNDTKMGNGADQVSLIPIWLTGGGGTRRKKIPGEGFNSGELKKIDVDLLTNAVKKTMMCAEELLPFAFALRPWEPYTLGDAIGWLEGFMAAFVQEDPQGSVPKLKSSVIDRLGTRNGECTDYEAHQYLLVLVGNIANVTKYVKPICGRAYDPSFFAPKHSDIFLYDLEGVVDQIVDGSSKYLQYLRSTTTNLEEDINSSYTVINLWHDGFQPKNKLRVLVKQVTDALNSINVGRDNKSCLEKYDMHKRRIIEQLKCDPRGKWEPQSLQVNAEVCVIPKIIQCRCTLDPCRHVKLFERLQDEFDKVGEIKNLETKRGREIEKQDELKKLAEARQGGAEKQEKKITIEEPETQVATKKNETTHEKLSGTLQANCGQHGSNRQLSASQIRGGMQNKRVRVFSAQIGARAEEMDDIEYQSIWQSIWACIKNLRAPKLSNTADKGIFVAVALAFLALMGGIIVLVLRIRPLLHMYDPIWEIEYQLTRVVKGIRNLWPDPEVTPDYTEMARQLREAGRLSAGKGQ